MGSVIKASGRRLRYVAVCSVFLAITACTAMIKNHGYVPSETDLSQIVIGTDTRETVVATLGPPTSGGVLEGSDIYYVASQFRHYGGFAPQEIDRKVVVISFANGGAVSNIAQLTLQDGTVVDLARRVTDDGISDVTFLSQLFGNLGNIDASSLFGAE
jgi:outer membrane protein assembly factor BamE (lipoprotein component of BamABCDE complex)